MTRGKCIKCGSTDVRSGALVRGKGSELNSIPVSALTWAELDNFVCARCGYVESYIARSEKLKKIVEKWPKVPAR